MKKLYNLFIYLFIIVFAFMGLIYSSNNGLLLTILTIMIFVYLVYKKKIPKFGWILLITSFIIRLIVILVLKTEPISDFKTLLDASESLLKGDMSFSSTPYFKMWGYQTGFVVYQALILKLFNSVFFLKILNAFYSSILVLLVYLFSRKTTDEKSAKMASLLYMVLLLPLVLNTVLTNQHLSALLIYLGIYFILNGKNTYKDYIISGVLVSLGNIIRPEGIVIVTTLFVYMFLLLRKNNLKESIVKFSVFLLSYLLIGCISSTIIIKTNINESGLKNKDPLWKFVLGFNHDTCGFYDEDDTYLVGDKDKELEVIKDRIKNPIKDIELVACKTNKFWLLNDMSWDSNSNKSINLFGLNIEFNKIESLALSYNSYINVIGILLGLFGVWFYRHDKELKKGLFFIILILVTFGVYTLIEIQPRYAYFIEVTIFILSSYGISAIRDCKKKYMKNRK